MVYTSNSIVFGMDVLQSKVKIIAGNIPRGTKPHLIDQGTYMQRVTWIIEDNIKLLFTGCVVNKKIINYNRTFPQTSVCINLRDWSYDVEKF